MCMCTCVCIRERQHGYSMDIWGYSQVKKAAPPFQIRNISAVCRSLSLQGPSPWNWVAFPEVRLCQGLIPDSHCFCLHPPAWRRCSGLQAKRGWNPEVVKSFESGPVVFKYLIECLTRLPSPPPGEQRSFELFCRPDTLASVCNDNSEGEQGQGLTHQQMCSRQMLTQSARTGNIFTSLPTCCGPCSSLGDEQLGKYRGK